MEPHVTCNDLLIKAPARPSTCIRRDWSKWQAAQLTLAEGFRPEMSQNAGFVYLRVMRFARDRSSDAFERLYDRVGRRLLVHLVRRMQHVGEATELWAECWAQAFEAWTRCRAETESAEEAWVFGIARNQLGSYYRSGRLSRQALERLSWTIPVAHEDDHYELARLAGLGELRSALNDALEHLPANRRRAIQLRVIEGLGYEQVAARMGCSQQAARAHVSRGLRALADRLDHDELTALRGAA